MNNKILKEIKEEIEYLIKVYYDNPTISKEEAISMFENKFKQLENTKENTMETKDIIKQIGADIASKKVHVESRDNYRCYTDGTKEVVITTPEELKHEVAGRQYVRTEPKKMYTDEEIFIKY